MKSNLLKAIIIFLLFSEMTLMAQAPQKMSYQMVVRNASNALVVNSPVRIRTSIYRTSLSGQLMYEDWHYLNTNSNGLVSLIIGTGTNQFGSFSNINWGNDLYFLKTEVDPTGNFTMSVVGETQLLSVPYAFFAEKSNPTNPIFQYSHNGNVVFSTLRNTWVNYPYTTITVAKTGQYLLEFSGNVFNDNLYSGGTMFDAKAAVRVYNETSNTEYINMNATVVDQWLQNFEMQYKYSNIQPSNSKVVNLNAGDVLRVDYMQTILGGVTAPSTQWMIGQTNLSILKVGD